MKRLLFFLFTASLGFSAPSQVKVLQVEYIRGSAYSPDPKQSGGLALQDFTAAVTHAIAPATSDHATQVMIRLIGGNAKGLVASPLMECEASNFGGATRLCPVGLNTGRTLDPAVPTWEVENHSWGGTDQIWENNVSIPSAWQSALWGSIAFNPGELNREKARIEKYNVVALIALPDPGLLPTRLLCAAQSRNILKVGSVSGQVTTAEYAPDVICADALSPNPSYTSYTCPTVAQTVIAMISWCKDHGVAYNAGDLCDIVRAQAAGNHLLLDHAACMAALASKYLGSSPVGSPTVTPRSYVATVGQQVSFTAAGITGTPPIALQWGKDGQPIPGATGAAYTIASASLGDAGAYVITASNSAGIAASPPATLTVIALPTPIPTPSPLPTPSPSPMPTPSPHPTPTPSPVPTATPDQQCTAIATSLGVSYDPTTRTFGNCSSAQVKQLYQQLTAQGL